MPITKFAGVDFSGARDAGKHIWVCEGKPAAGRLHITACYPAADLPGGTVARNGALMALHDHIATRRGTLFGLDFPPGLPRAVMLHDSWAAMVRHFAEDYPDAEAFRERCKTTAGGREIRRHADIEAATPFCAYNLRLYRQTYYGLRDLIAPLVNTDSVRVLPFQSPADDLPMLAESCPASTLKALDLYAPYKGSGAAMQDARRRLLDAICEQGAVNVPDALRDLMVQTPGGDALDALLAAFGVWQYVESGSPLNPPGDDYAVEGYVYFANTL